MSQAATIRAYFNALMKIVEPNYIGPQRFDETSLWEYFSTIRDDDPDKIRLVREATFFTLKKKVNKHSLSFWPDPNGTPYIQKLPTGEMKNGNVAYITLPEAAGSERINGKYMIAGRAVLQDLLAQNPIGAIVDLRHNLGGDCSQMLAAIAPLLDADNYVDWPARNPELNGSIKWDHANQVIKYKSEDFGFPTTYNAPPNETLPVAVLYGKDTASSGEITALAFKGSPLSKSFGYATSGFTTCNNVYDSPLPEIFGHGKILLTTSMLADRNGKIYNNTPIEPDIECIDPMKDDSIERAIEWIQGFKAQSPR